MKQVSICTPTYNRLDLVLNSFAKVKDDDRVNHIHLVDDCSLTEYIHYLKISLKYDKKVTVHENIVNFDCYKNKKEAVSKSTTDYLLLIDSDNQIGADYLDAIFNEEWDAKTILQPSFAQPMFDFREYEGLVISKENVAEYIGKPMFDTMLNAMNFFVNRDEYLKVWDDNVDPVTADSIYFNYCWLANGGKIKVVPNLYYQHLVHNGSHYKNNVSRTPSGFYESVIERLKQLK